tara:strand:+ start:84 stop:617 length:534 start_codon:yes stop_codon:yes gene_type:complete
MKENLKILKNVVLVVAPIGFVYQRHLPTASLLSIDNTPWLIAYWLFVPMLIWHFVDSEKSSGTWSGSPSSSPSSSSSSPDNLRKEKSVPMKPAPAKAFPKSIKEVDRRKPSTPNHSKDTIKEEVTMYDFFTHPLYKKFETREGIDLKNTQLEVIQIYKLFKAYLLLNHNIEITTKDK